MMSLHKKHQIIRADSCLSVLQQRLKYARTTVDRSISYFVENVPMWPIDKAPTPLAPPGDIFNYADCNGSGCLIDTICQRDNLIYNLALSRENILVTNGGMHALSLAFKNINRVAINSSAVCLAPVFGAVPALMKINGYEVIYYHMTEAIPSVEQLLALCRVDTKLVYLNFPHNPLGGIYSDAFMRELVQSLTERGIALVLDLVYDSYIFDNNKILSPLTCTNNFSLVYTVNSVSKNYGAPGLRIGWVTSSPENIDAMAGALETECVAICSPAQSKATQLISDGNVALHQQVSRSRKIVQDFLKRQGSEVINLPPAGTQIFVTMPVQDIEEFADQMLGEYGLVLATASNYVGTTGSQLRIPTGYSEAITINALELLSHGIERYRNR